MSAIVFTSVLDKMPDPDSERRHIALTEEGYVFMLPYTEEDKHRGVWFDRENDCGAVIAWIDGSDIAIAACHQFSTLFNRWGKSKE